MEKAKIIIDILKWWLSRLIFSILLYLFICGTIYTWSLYKVNTGSSIAWREPAVPMLCYDVEEPGMINTKGNGREH